MSYIRTVIVIIRHFLFSAGEEEKGLLEGGVKMREKLSQTPIRSKSIF
jgi:hypothetical protein